MGIAYACQSWPYSGHGVRSTVSLGTFVDVVLGGPLAIAGSIASPLETPWILMHLLRRIARKVLPWALLAPEEHLYHHLRILKG
jgi:hypothetical protein